MENRICPSCKTENEPEYTFCKNCGTPLSAPSASVQKNTGDTAFTPAAESNDYGQSSYQAGNGGVFIDGNPIDKVLTFVGKNADKIVPKFMKINESGSKIQWCWPPFIWGFLLGPIGVAIWFLYRKMYKPACIFGAIAAAFSYITAFVNHFVGITADANARLDGYFDSIFSGRPFDFGDFLYTLESRDILISNMLGTVENAVNIVCALVAGLFGIYIYKKYTARKIHLYNPILNDPNYVKIGLASAGGTSVGAAILGSIIISVISGIPAVIFGIIKFAEVMYRT